MANASYEAGLQAKLDDGTINPDSITGRRIQRVLKCKNENRKKRALNHMEERSRMRLGLTHDEAVDWKAKSIDWQSIFAMLVKWIPIILALFGI